jgi:ABC-type Fe3+ transport system substrate-binding protein
LNGVALYDQSNSPPHWYGAALSSFGITYNVDVLRSLKIDPPVINTWNDLKNPAMCNWLIAADPSRSTSSKAAFMAIVERAMQDSAEKGESESIGWARGMGTIRLILSNARNFVDGSGIVPGIIASGDAAAGMTIDYYGRTEVGFIPDHRLAYVQPKNATITNSDPIAMVLGAEHRAAAQLFIEFVLGRQGQLLWNTKAGAPGGPRTSNLYRLPIMPSLYSDMSNFTDQVNPFAAGEAFNKQQKREDPTFGIIGELIQASCINNLEDLRETRQVILKSPRADELDARLGKFPFDMNEAARRSAEYKKADPVNQLALMRAWTEEFKAEYATLRTEAALGK